MNTLHQSLNESIRIQDSDILNEVCIIESTDHNYYIPESWISDIEEEYELHSRSRLLDYIKESYGIKDLIVIDEHFDEQICLDGFLYEANVKDIHKYENGYNTFKLLLDKIVSVVKDNPADTESQIKRYIERYDKILEDIRNEIEKTFGEDTRKDQLKFSIKFIADIAEDAMEYLLVPSLIGKATSSDLSQQEQKNMILKLANGWYDKLPSILKIMIHIKFVPTRLLGKIVFGFKAINNIHSIVISLTDYKRILYYYEKRFKMLKRSAEDHLSEIQHRNEKKRRSVSESCYLDDYEMDLNSVFCESLSVRKVLFTANGYNPFAVLLDKLFAFMCNEDYSTEQQIQRYINTYYKILDDIKEEKELVKNKAKTSQAKFSAVFLAKSIINILTVIQGNKNIINGIKNDSVIDKLLGAILVGSVGINTGFKISPGIKDTYMSFRDYMNILDQYEAQYKRLIAKAEADLRSIERRKEMKNSMVKLREHEEFFLEDNVEVNYQTHDELIGGSDRREVMHDDMDDFEDCCSDDPENCECQKRDLPEFDPNVVMNQAKADPKTVLITKFNDRYYIDYKALKEYLKAVKHQFKKDMGIDEAVDKIAESHELSINSVSVLLNESDLLEMDNDFKYMVENASTQFDVYK